MASGWSGQAAAPAVASPWRPPTEGAADLARSKGIPLFMIGLGSEQPLKDVELSDLRVPEVSFVDDILSLQIQSPGHADSPAARSRCVSRTRIPAPCWQDNPPRSRPTRKPQETTLTYRPDKIGDYDFVVETDKLPDEVRSDNNRLQRQVSVRKARIRVLLVQAYPSYEFRYLKNLLERDNTIEVHTVLQDADVEYASEDKTALAVFPVRREDLFAYDVVIFGDVESGLAEHCGHDESFRFRAAKRRAG